MVVLGVVLEQVEALAKPLLVPVLKKTSPAPPKPPPGPPKTTQNEKQNEKRRLVQSWMKIVAFFDFRFGFYTKN